MHPCIKRASRIVFCESIYQVLCWSNVVRIVLNTLDYICVIHVLIILLGNKKVRGLDCSAFARRYWRNLIWFIFLRLLRCFSSPGILPSPSVFFILVLLSKNCLQDNPCKLFSAWNEQMVRGHPDFSGRGYPIRKPPGKTLVEELTGDIVLVHTSFFGTNCQGILQWHSFSYHLRIRFIRPTFWRLFHIFEIIM